jgi:ParB family chromosome partitioning protein
MQYDGDEWYTPADVIELARELMGGIDLDPASCEAAQTVVQADTYFTKAENGLAQPWRGRVWLNPPYSNPCPWTDKARAAFEDRDVEQCVILVNNATETGWFQRLLRKHPACFLSGRISFWRPDRDSTSPRQGQVVFYLGFYRGAFWERFKGLGTLVQAY